jgi:hypothetical protein
VCAFSGRSFRSEIQVPLLIASHELTHLSYPSRGGSSSADSALLLLLSGMFRTDNTMKLVGDWWFVIQLFRNEEQTAFSSPFLHKETEQTKGQMK